MCQGQDVLVYINTCIPYTFKTYKAFETFPFGASRRPGGQYIISSLNVKIRFKTTTFYLIKKKNLNILP